MSVSNTAANKRHQITSDVPYKLLVTAGSSYDPKKQQVVTVNDPEPLLIDGPDMTIKLHVRVRDFDGLPLTAPRHSPYFDHAKHRKDLYSISFSFTPKKSINSANLVWGNDFDHPIRDQLPPCFNFAYKIAKTFIDPGINCDAYSDRPWSYGPALSCWFSFRVGERERENGLDDADGRQTQREISPAVDEHVVEEGADGDGKDVREGFSIPPDAKNRRKHFLSASNRQAFSFEAGRTYYADFHNPYFDPNKVILRLPGCKIRVLKYVNDRTHSLRYVFKDTEKDEVYLVVVLKLLFGQELTRQLAHAS